MEAIHLTTFYSRPKNVNMNFVWYLLLSFKYPKFVFAKKLTFCHFNFVVFLTRHSQDDTAFTFKTSYAKPEVQPEVAVGAGEVLNHSTAATF